jgi:hypothetical protein
MTARNQWSQGLQWGACAWLCYVVLRELGGELSQLLAREGSPWTLPRWMCGWGYGWHVAAVWAVALSLIIVGSRWSRVAVAAAISMQALVAVRSASSYAGEPDSVWFVLRFFLPMCVPLLPLLVLRVEQPRVALALAALGRWSEARVRFGGIGVLAVAIAVISLNRGALDLLGYGLDPAAVLQVIHDRGLPWTGYLLPVVLFGLAALTIEATSRPLRRPSTAC